MMVVRSFDYIVENEHEALVLERNLIAQYRPYFNVDFKDDKSYPYIAIISRIPSQQLNTRARNSQEGVRAILPYTTPYARARLLRRSEK